MINARRRVLGALVAVVLTAAGITGLSVSTTSVVTDNAIANQRALTAEAVLSTETVRGDKLDPRRLVVEHFGLAPTVTGVTAATHETITTRAGHALDASPRLAARGRAPPVSL